MPLAIVLLGAGGAPVAPAPDLAALGVPAYPDMQFQGGGATPTEASGEASSQTQNRVPTVTPPVLTGLFRYTSDAPYEDVVAFYERELGVPEVRVKPIDLGAAHRGQEIPESARGRRRLFRVTPRAGAPQGPAGPDPADLMNHALHAALGGTNILVSDHSVDPESGAVRAATTIEILLFR